MNKFKKTHYMIIKDAMFTVRNEHGDARMDTEWMSEIDREKHYNDRLWSHLWYSAQILDQVGVEAPIIDEIIRTPHGWLCDLDYERLAADILAVLPIPSGDDVHPNLEAAYSELKAECIEADEYVPGIMEVNEIMLEMEHPATQHKHMTTASYWWGDVLMDYLRFDLIDQRREALEQEITMSEAAELPEQELKHRHTYAVERFEFCLRCNLTDHANTWGRRCEDRSLQYHTYKAA